MTGGEGLKEMLAARRFPFECTFCGEALPKRKKSQAGRVRIRCNDVLCRRAYQRCWWRDRQAALAEVSP